MRAAMTTTDMRSWSIETKTRESSWGIYHARSATSGKSLQAFATRGFDRRSLQPSMFLNHWDMWCRIRALNRDENAEIPLAEIGDNKFHFCEWVPKNWRCRIFRQYTVLWYEHHMEKTGQKCRTNHKETRSQFQAVSFSMRFLIMLSSSPPWLQCS